MGQQHTDYVIKLSSPDLEGFGYQQTDKVGKKKKNTLYPQQVFASSRGNSTTSNERRNWIRKKIECTETGKNMVEALNGALELCEQTSKNIAQVREKEAHA